MQAGGHSWACPQQLHEAESDSDWQASHLEIAAAAAIPFPWLSIVGCSLFAPDTAAPKVCRAHIINGLLPSTCLADPVALLILQRGGVIPVRLCVDIPALGRARTGASMHSCSAPSWVLDSNSIRAGLFVAGHGWMTWECLFAACKWQGLRQAAAGGGGLCPFTA